MPPTQAGNAKVQPGATGFSARRKLDEPFIFFLIVPATFRRRSAGYLRNLSAFTFSTRSYRRLRVRRARNGP